MSIFQHVDSCPPPRLTDRVGGIPLKITIPSTLHLPSPKQARQAEGLNPVWETNPFDTTTLELLPFGTTPFGTILLKCQPFTMSTLCQVLLATSRWRGTRSGNRPRGTIPGNHGAVHSIPKGRQSKGLQLMGNQPYKLVLEPCQGIIQECFMSRPACSMRNDPVPRTMSRMSQSHGPNHEDVTCMIHKIGGGGHVMLCSMEWSIP